jgi:hypothetical protein
VAVVEVEVVMVLRKFGIMKVDQEMVIVVMVVEVANFLLELQVVEERVEERQVMVVMVLIIKLMVMVMVVQV